MEHNVCDVTPCSRRRRREQAGQALHKVCANCRVLRCLSSVHCSVGLSSGRERYGEGWNCHISAANTCHCAGDGGMSQDIVVQHPSVRSHQTRQDGGRGRA